MFFFVRLRRGATDTSKEKEEDRGQVDDDGEMDHNGGRVRAASETSFTDEKLICSANSFTDKMSHLWQKNNYSVYLYYYFSLYITHLNSKIRSADQTITWRIIRVSLRATYYFVLIDKII